MFEKNFKLIEEVIDSIPNMKLFSKRAFEVENIVEINDFEEAKFLAFDNLEYEMESERGYSWIDLRQLVMSDILIDKYKMKNYREFNKIITYEFAPRVSKQITVIKEYYNVEDDVYSDLCNCIECRGIYGENGTLFEKMYNVYKSGEWPCGWSGNYPDGKLIVFYPNR